MAQLWIVRHHECTLKKPISIGIAVVLIIVVAVLVWRYIRDVELRHEIVGSWSNGDRFVMTISPDGNISYGTSPSHNGFSGTWQVKAGVMIVTLTKSPLNNSLAGSHIHFSIAHVDDKQVVYKWGSGSNESTITLTRQ